MKAHSNHKVLKWDNMNYTQLILTALSQVPDLVEAARTYKEVNDKAINTISIAVKKQPEAIIPDSEMKKLKNSISQTQCALPDADEFTKELAEQVYKIKSSVGATDITLKHEHTHRHYSYSASFDMINDTAKKWIIGLSISVVVLFGIIAYGIHYMRTSELFLGKRCMDIYMSDYVTEKEKKEMLKDCYWIAFYPKKYQDSPQALRERIRKNEAVINDREF